MSRNITARDYLPGHVLRDIENRNEKARQRRIETFLPRLEAHGYVDTHLTITGVLELVGPARLQGSSESWVRAIIHEQDAWGHVTSTKIMIPRIITGIGRRRIVPGECSKNLVTLDISAAHVDWYDRVTDCSVYSAVPIVLRRHM